MKELEELIKIMETIKDLEEMEQHVNYHHQNPRFWKWLVKVTS